MAPLIALLLGTLAARSIGWLGWAGQGYGNGLFHLLPYIEQNNLYKKSEAGGILFAGNNNVYASPIPLLQCPSDPSLGPNGVQTDNQGKTWGGNTYAGNVCAFAYVDPDGTLLRVGSQLQTSAASTSP